MTASASLAACGGAGGGGPAVGRPAPPPAPTPTPSTSLLSLTASESFPTDAATGTVSVNRTTQAATATAARSTVTIAFDQPSGGYTITAGARSITFLPSDTDAAQSNDDLLVLVKRNGTTTDSLTLTRGGTAGRFTFQYVGSGFWQRATENTNTVDGTIDAFVYGFPTAAAAVPRTGKGSYDVDLIGVISPDQGITGSGQLEVLFDSGTILISGNLDNTGALPQNSGFSGAAQLGAGRSFTGSFVLDALGEFTGSVDGGFYGPQGQEVGGAFAVAQSDGRRAVGTITGRGGPQAASNTSLRAQTVNDFYVGEGGRLQATLSGASGSNTSAASYSGLNAANGDFVVNYNAASQAYTVVAGNRSASGDVSGATTIERFGLLDTQGAFTRTSAGFATNRYNELEYVAAARWFRQDGNGNNSDYLIDELAFGITTPNSALPRTGEGGYAIGVFGTAADPDANNLMLFAGQGTLLANFGSGAIMLNAGVNYAEDIQLSGVTPQTASGTLTGTATLSASSNAFDGSVTLTGLGNYSGALSGSFFGPAAEEVGGGFSASDGAGRLVGSFVGERDDSILAAGTPLLELPSPSSFEVFGLLSGSLATSNFDGQSIVYSPDTGAYRLAVDAGELQRLGLDPGLATAFTAANRVAGESNASFTVNRVVEPGTGSDKRITGRLFNAGAGNTTLALTYTSFIDVVVQEVDLQGQLLGNASTMAVPFGVVTPPAALPRSGTATYNGVAFARGVVVSSVNLEVSGTTSLVANFGDNSFTASVALPNVGAVQNVAPFNFAGFIATNGFVGNGTVSVPEGQVGNSGTFIGRFFGPAADEFGAVFDAFRSGPDGSLSVSGIAVGKKN
ncbi:MAG: beta strand repeat-containing protein [Polymorphobacter sp.]|uniref:beta strand repeat-containing protein n=1 Tax=Polymorphobacter sp. TaxID=1909290 RepID=UPI003A87C92C